jgi:hypothetical protein
MRDEVLAKWRIVGTNPVLNVYCHVSGGFVLGRAGWRYSIFRRELPLVLEVFRYGDRMIYLTHLELDSAPIKVHFSSHLNRYNKLEIWGTPEEYQIECI